ncbi:MAG: ribosome-associated protein [Flavobacteriales bacterium]|jgi:ribosome-associated protein
MQGGNMGLKQELQELHKKLEKARRKFDGAKLRKDYAVAAEADKQIQAFEKQLASLNTQKSSSLSGQATEIKALAFSRVLTKAEQADMGKLKKAVRGLVTVHPMTALGREMGVEKMTGFAPKEF